MPVLKINKNGVWQDVANALSHAHTMSDIADLPASIVDDVEALKDKVGANSVAYQISTAVTTNAYQHPYTHPASMITGLSDVAISGDYNDLTNKPTFADVATSGEYSDLKNIPKQIQADWDTTDANDVSYIKNKPIIPSIEGLATEQFVQDAIANLNISGGTGGGSGSGGGDIQPDWNQNDDTQLDYIKNKPFNEYPVEYKIIDNKEYSFILDGSMCVYTDTATLDDVDKYNNLTNIVNLFNKDWDSASVKWGDSEYSNLRPYIFEGNKFFGNSVLTSGVDNGIPFTFSATFENEMPVIVIVSVYDTEDTVHRLTVTLHGTEIKKLDNKYLDILDYIDSTEEDVLPLTMCNNFTLNESFQVNMQIVETVITLNVGETYHVQWNNDVFTCVAQDVGVVMPGHIALGNCAPFDSSLSGNNEPFIIAAYATNTIIVPLIPDTTEVTIRVYKEIPGRYVLKDEYKPTDADWETLKNKPFGNIEYNENITLSSSLVSCDIDGMMMYKISDFKPSKEQLLSCTIECDVPGASEKIVFTFTDTDLSVIGDENQILMSNDHPFLVCYKLGPVTDGGITIDLPETGLYFYNVFDFPMESIFNIQSQQTKCLDNKYLSILNFVKGKETDILPKTKLGPFSYDSTYGCYTEVTGPDYELIIGEKYFVTWDNATYECVAQDADAAMPGMNLVALGNCTSFHSSLSGNNEPFIIAVATGMGITYLSLTDTSEYSRDIRIYQKTEDGYTFNDKYTPDWEQSNPDLPGYIKNKPFGKIYGKETLFSGTYTCDGANNQPAVIPYQSNTHFIEGNMYTVIFDGTTYSNCECTLYDGLFLCIGNIGYMYNFENDNGMPFVIVDDVNGVFGFGQGFIYIDAYNFDIVSTKNVTLLYEGNFIKKIDAEYIDQSDWNNDDENSAGYIKNKPFYSIPAGTFILNNATINCKVQESETEYIGMINNFLNIETGKKYNIVFDGVLYENNIAQNSEAVFSISTDDVYCMIGKLGPIWVLLSSQGEHTLTISTAEEYTQQIDPKFIPKIDGLPEVSEEHEGKSLKVVDGKWDIAEALPDVNVNDAGKFLRVSSDGKWTLSTVLNAEEVKF